MVDNAREGSLLPRGRRPERGRERPSSHRPCTGPAPQAGQVRGQDALGTPDVERRSHAALTS